MQDICGSGRSDSAPASEQYFLDISADQCPMTFVRTRLALERLPPGARLIVRLKGAEPLRNVPRALREIGHLVLAVEAEEDGQHRLLVERG